MSRAISGDVQPPDEVGLVGGEKTERDLVRLALERPIVTPLCQVAGGGRQRYLEELILGHFGRVRVLCGESLERLEIETKLGFGRVRRLQLAVAEPHLHRRAADDCECLILCIERWTQPCRTPRNSKLELIDSAHLKVFRHAPGARGAIVGRVAVVGAEQRGLVAAHQPVDDVAIPDVERRYEVRVAAAYRECA